MPKVTQFESFDEFYKQAVEPLRKQNPTYIRLDGCISGSSRKAFAYFIFEGNRWKVDSDTHIEKLQKAYRMSKSGETPFSKMPTKGGKGECLVITKEPLLKKLLYIYKVS